MDDPRVVRALRSSVVLAPVAAVIDVVWNAARQSQVGARVAALKSRWDAESGAGQRRAVGVMLTVAALVNLALTSVADHPAGWLWTMPAALAMSIGVVLVVSSTGRGAV